MTVVLGLLWAGLMNLAFEKNANGWRWSLGIAVTCPTVLLIGSFFLPESPRKRFLNFSLSMFDFMLRVAISNERGRSCEKNSPKITPN